MAFGRAIMVTPAASALHPELAALAGPGETALPPLRVGVAGEPADVVVARAARPAIGYGDGGALTLAFDAGDAAFAVALIAAAALPETVPAGRAAPMRALLATAAKVAARDVGVLIAGPTGTGKEGLARFVHARSGRRAAPFVAVNCAAIPETMLEATLFGTERGAFTGALTATPGLFRAAAGGTLLLDEISEMPLALQVKLLRALQEREVLPVGASRPVAVDVRIVATSNRDLAGEVAAGRFRADLFYRVAVFPLTTVPLAERPDDIVPIAAALWLRQRFTAWPTPAALDRLRRHGWPGNVRELGNVIARAAVLADNDRIDADHIVLDAVAPREARSLDTAVRLAEQERIRGALMACGGRRAETARQLGISARTLRYKLAAMAQGATLQ